MLRRYTFDDLVYGNLNQFGTYLADDAQTTIKVRLCVLTGMLNLPPEQEVSLQCLPVSFISTLTKLSYEMTKLVQSLGLVTGGVNYVCLAGVLFGEMIQCELSQATITCVSDVLLAKQDQASDSQARAISEVYQLVSKHAHCVKAISLVKVGLIAYHRNLPGFATIWDAKLDSYAETYRLDERCQRTKLTTRKPTKQELLVLEAFNTIKAHPVLTTKDIITLSDLLK